MAQKRRRLSCSTFPDKVVGVHGRREDLVADGSVEDGLKECRVERASVVLVRSGKGHFHVLLHDGCRGNRIACRPGSSLVDGGGELAHGVRVLVGPVFGREPDRPEEVLRDRIVRVGEDPDFAGADRGRQSRVAEFRGVDPPRRHRFGHRVLRKLGEFHALRIAPVRVEPGVHSDLIEPA